MKNRKRTNGKQKPEPMVFEHVPVEQTEYERVSDRVMAAVTEINAALQEAHECAEMRVFLAARQRTADHAMNFQPQIYRLTHSTMAFTIKVNQDADPKMQWRAVKDPAFEEAAGVGLSVLQNKKR